MRALLTALLLAAATAAPAAQPVELDLFYGQGCPHCADMRQALQRVRRQYPELRLREHEVYVNAENARLFERAIFIAVALLAVVVAPFNLKDYLWYGRWFAMEVPQSWRPALKKLLQGVTSVPGAFLVGFVVSLFLLPCTSGPYIVVLGLLAKSSTQAQAALWLLLYNAIFVLPMIAITGAVYLGWTTAEALEQWRTRSLRVLHLVAGVVLLLLGLGLLASLKFGLV